MNSFASEIYQMPLIHINSFKLLKSDIQEQSLKNMIQYHLNTGSLIRVKQGRYVTHAYLNQKQDGYERYIANQLYQPSYISLGSALDYYHMLTESTLGYSSVSPKKTTSYTNILGTFSYRSMREDLICGYIIKKIGSYEIKIATKSKALFDYLRYRKKLFRYINDEELLSMRLNFEQMSTGDREEFSGYVDRSGSQKMARLYSLCIDLCDKQK